VETIAAPLKRRSRNDSTRRRVEEKERAAYLALGDLGLDVGPSLGLSSVGEEVHDDGRLANSLVNFEEVFASNPAIGLGLLPGLSTFPYTDNDVETIVAEVEALAVALGAVANQGKSVVLEVFL